MTDLKFLDFAVDLESAETVAACDELSLWSAMFGILLLDQVPLAGVKDALDVGCGAGFPLIELAERLGPEAHVHGVDVWRAALARAAAKAAARNTRNVTLHDCTAAALPFDDAVFDLVVSNLGINNFDDREAVVRECRRVLKPGATIALTTNLQGHMRELYAAFERTIEQDDEARRRLRSHVEHRATVGDVRALLERSGFSVTRVVEREETMRFASGTAFFDHYFVKLGFLDAWKSVIDPGDHQVVFSRLRIELDEVARGAGELRMTIPMAYIQASAS